MKIRVYFKIAGQEISIRVNTIDMAVKMSNHAIKSYGADYARIAYQDYLDSPLDPRD